ncbi:XRE family transcriptional regulator, partial [Candidatus Micrarchaeota archaeon CG10_big_fil_rev_8_21_14_0_10_59_7]
MGASLSKAEQAYLYIIEKLQDSPNFGKTLFYKTLYFSDFDNYELREQSITGGEYRKIE